MLCFLSIISSFNFDPEDFQQQILEECKIVECRAKGGNCVESECKFDSGYDLHVELFNIPKPLEKYTWETESMSNQDLKNISDQSGGQIPHIVHQSWKSLTIPERLRPYQENCRKTHEGWKFILWSDDDNMELVRREYPELLYFYQRIRSAIEKADFMRYLYMQSYGGLYMDIDVDCIRNTEDLIKDKKVVLGVLGPYTKFKENIPNAIIFSIKNHVFWRFLVHHIVFRSHWVSGVVDQTGPIVLRDAYLLFKEFPEFKDDIYLTEPGILYGVDWHVRGKEYPYCQLGRGKDIEKCMTHFPNIYLITFWYHSW